MSVLIDSFDWVESPGTTLTETPRVLATQFGDGYEQRSADGLNSRPQTWDVRLTGVENAVAAEIIAFFRLANGVDIFDYTPLWETSPLRFKCPTWSRAQGQAWGESDITATFVQVFEP